MVAVINEDHKGRSPSRETVISHQKQRRGKTIQMPQHQKNTAEKQFLEKYFGKTK